jgi:hypothetical protein
MPGTNPRRESARHELPRRCCSCGVPAALRPPVASSRRREATSGRSRSWTENRSARARAPWRRRAWLAPQPGAGRPRPRNWECRRCSRSCPGADRRRYRLRKRQQKGSGIRARGRASKHFLQTRPEPWRWPVVLAVRPGRAGAANSAGGAANGVLAAANADLQRRGCRFSGERCRDYGSRRRPEPAAIPHQHWDCTVSRSRGSAVTG